jgi:hypothetical protein
LKESVTLGLEEEERVESVARECQERGKSFEYGRYNVGLVRILKKTVMGRLVLV